MRKLVLLVGMGALCLLSVPSTTAQIVPSWEAPSGQLGFIPIVNEISLYQNYDDAGENRGKTLQIISINSFKVFTTFNFEFTGDFNYRYSYRDIFDKSAGMMHHDYYIELSLVKPINSILSVNVQRIVATFEDESINQFGIRLSF